MAIPTILQINNPAVDTAAKDTTTAVTEKTISIWDLISSGGWYIMIPLGILSIITIYVFIERYLAIQKATRDESQMLNKIRDYVNDRKFEAAKDLCLNTDTPIARMLSKGIARIGKPVKDVSASIENEAKLEVYKLEKNLSSLATIAGVAPMIGFTGTVIGMIVTFHEMKISGEGIQIDQLSGGIMQAMVTTLSGLIIGIIAYIAYNILVTKVDKVVHQMESSSIEFLDLIEERSGKGESEQ